MPELNPWNPDYTGTAEVEVMTLQGRGMKPQFRRGLLLEAVAQKIYDQQRGEGEQSATGNSFRPGGAKTDARAEFLNECTCEGPDTRDRECVRCRSILRNRLRSILHTGEEVFDIPGDYSDKWPRIYHVLTGDLRKNDPEAARRVRRVRSNAEQERQSIHEEVIETRDRLRGEYETKRKEVYEKHLDLSAENLTLDEARERVRNLSLHEQQQVDREVEKLYEALNEAIGEAEARREEKLRELDQEVEDRIRSVAEEQGEDASAFLGSPDRYESGTPDRWDIVDGEVVGTEFKSGDAELREWQRLYAEVIAELGNPFIVARLNAVTVEKVREGLVCEVPYGGSQQYGIIVQKTDEDSGDYLIGNQSLVEYWADKDVTIPVHDPVWEVAIDPWDGATYKEDNLTVYPESLVAPLGVSITKEEVIDCPYGPFPWDEIPALLEIVPLQ